MKYDKIDILIEKYIDGGLSKKEFDEFERKIIADESFKKELTQRIEIHQLLSKSSGVFHKSYKERKKAKKKVFNGTVPAWGLAVAACFLGAFYFAIFTNQEIPNSEKKYFAQLTHGNIGSLGKGGFVGGDLLEIENHVVELTFFNGPMVALQGPGEFRIESQKKITLFSGKLVADIPPGAEGFTVVTGEGEIIDLGTRFGVSINQNGSVDAHVFEGEIQVSPRSNSQSFNLVQKEAVEISVDKTKRKPALISLFPKLRSESANLIPNGDFENGPNIGNEFLHDTQFHLTGDGSAIVGSENGIQPYRGKSMLKLLNTHNLSSPSGIKTGTFDLWFWYDLNNHTSEISDDLIVYSSIRLNRIAKEPGIDSLFALEVFGISEVEVREISKVQDLEPYILCSNRKSLEADANPKSWEILQLSLPLQPKVKHILAVATLRKNNRSDVRVDHEFLGHYFDDFTMRFKIPPLPSFASFAHEDLNEF